MKDIINNQSFLEELVNSSIQNVKDLAQTNTKVGDPIISPNGNIILPISKVSVGFVVGGGQYNSINKKTPYPNAGGSGGGVSVTPLGFIVESDFDVRFIDIENKSAYQTILNLANSLISKMNKKTQEDNNEGK